MKNTDVIQPLAMGSAIAADGDKEIPNQSEAGTNTSTINDGFLPLTSEPTSSGGRNPQRTNFNGMFYLSTDQRFYLQNGGVITYDPNVVAQIGGYPQDAILGYIDPTGNLGFVKSLINDNAYNFVQTPSYINGQYWEFVSILNVQPQINQLEISVKNARNIDYSSGITISTPTSKNRYTAPYDGVYITTVALNNTYGVKFYINGVESAYVYSENTTGTEHQAFYIPLSKGDVIYWTAAVVPDSSKFYKYKA